VSVEYHPSTGGSGLRVEGLTVRYGGNTALDDVSFTAARGETLGLIGANGAGKSTLLRTVAGLERPHRGAITHDGVDLTAQSFRRRCRDTLALTFQIPRAAPQLTVEEQLAAQRQGLGHLLSPRSRPHVLAVREVIERMDLGLVSQSRPSELTLGEERRFELARAVLNEPSLLLVDEPSSGMSAEEALHLADALKMIAQTGVTIILVEHNIPFIRTLTANTVVLDAGRKLLSGPTPDVLASKEVKESYLGRAAA
jgi:ABC-type branched-subunit amino acid transport system ATPase component